MTRRLIAILISAAIAIVGLGVVGTTQAVPAAAAATAKVKIKLTIKNPIGECGLDTVKKLILGPEDRTKICAIENLVLGHAYPKPKKPGYLQTTVGKLKIGLYVKYQGVTYKVKSITSIKKEKLFTIIKSLTSSDRYLITCDTTKGYKNHHAINNLVARLVKA